MYASEILDALLEYPEDQEQKSFDTPPWEDRFDTTIYLDREYWIAAINEKGTQAFLYRVDFDEPYFNREDVLNAYVCFDADYGSSGLLEKHEKFLDSLTGQSFCLNFEQLTPNAKEIYLELVAKIGESWGCAIILP